MPIASTLLTQFLIARFLSPFTAGAFVEALRNFASGFAHAAAPVAVTALWQGAVVAAGLALCLRLAPRVTAAHRFAAWAAGFSVLVALPFVPALTQFVTSAADSNIEAASLPSPAAHAWLAHPLIQISERWSLAIAALWVLMALARAIDLAIHTARLRRLWKTATPIAATTRQAGFVLCTTRELDRPSVIGFFAPRILIPEWLMERLSPQELDQVVLHEAEHLRRRDDWTNLLQKLCLMVFPLNPALAFIERRLCGEREMACDEGVVRRTQAPRAYAACLAGLAERHMEHRAEALGLGARAKALTLSAFERRPELARRVHSILVRRSVINPMMSRALVGAVGCALAVGALALARCPQLVAFVPEEPRVTVATAQIAADMVTDERKPQAAAEFHAINTMAIMPQTVRQRIAASKRETAQAACPHAQDASLLRSAINAAQAIKNSSPELAANKTSAAAEQELIVFTTYEGVRTSGELGDRVISDFQSQAADGQAAGGYQGKFTMTQLVFRVYPAANDRADGEKPTTETAASTSQPGLAIQPGNAGSKLSNSATGKPAGQATQPDANSRNANSSSSQPHAIPLGNGWFVIQL
jgi:beta-lactamase regulating signal transducer with metallopeptidase domain